MLYRLILKFIQVDTKIYTGWYPSLYWDTIKYIQNICIELLKITHGDTNVSAWWLNLYSLIIRQGDDEICAVTLNFTEGRIEKSTGWFWSLSRDIIKCIRMTLMIVLRDTKVNTGRYVYNADNEFL